MFCFSFFLFSLLLIVFSFFVMNFNSIIVEFWFPFFWVNELCFSFLFDFISLIFFSCVSFIGSMVFYYSFFYMGVCKKENSDQIRFFSLLFLFIVSMFLLVFSYSWIIIFLGWDGLGAVSFLLVIYYNDSSSLNSGLVTVFTNRLGDCLFILSFMFMYYCGNFSFCFLLDFNIFLFLLFLILGAVTKSAQFPFSSWLPAAMAAPTPISSLVHSSTLVTAGVFLLIRFNYLFFNGFLLLSILSLITMMMGGLLAIWEIDFKKIVAMSTLSQLGFMIFSISIGNWLLGFFHMVFHAFFKSSLFLSTGGLMHVLMGDQDSRSFGGFVESFFSKLFFSLSCLSLMGFPFSLGFYSKDMIIGVSLFLNGSVTSFIYVISCFFTVVYSVRLLNLGFLGFPSFGVLLNFQETKSFFMPILFLFIFYLFCGNFFLYFYFPFFLFSFVEIFMGLILILCGIFFNKISLEKFFLFSFFSSVGFLSFINSFFSSTLLNKNHFHMFDYTWMECLVSFFSKNVLIKLNNLLTILFSLKFFYMFFLMFVIVSFFLFYVLIL